MMSHQKSGQITLFLILVALLSITAVLLYSSGSLTIPSSFFHQSEPDPVKAYVQQCVQSGFSDAISEVMFQGGHYGVFTNSMAQGPEEDTDTAYYLHKGELFVPQSPDIERELEQGALDAISACQDLSGYPYRIDYSTSAPKATVSIVDGVVELRASPGITVRSQESSTLMGDILISAPSSLGQLLGIARDMASRQQQDGAVLCLSCILDISEQKGISIQMEETDTPTGKILLYSLEDPLAAAEDASLSDDVRTVLPRNAFRFAHFIAWPEEGQQ